jgi:hypothetical protein
MESLRTQTSFSVPKMMAKLVVHTLTCLDCAVKRLKDSLVKAFVAIMDVIANTLQ